MIVSSILLATLVSAGVINIPVKLRPLHEAPDVASHLLQRRGVLHGTPHMDDTFYEASLLVGTPPQELTATFDTGSITLSFPGANSTECLAGNCDAFGNHTTYNISKSSSWRYAYPKPDWYGHGIAGNETVGFADTKVGMQMWVSTDHMQNSAGIFGHGPTTVQQPGGDVHYASFVLNLANNGLISRALFSVVADAPIDNRNFDTNWKSTAVQVYYGGFDESRYQGPLTTVDCDTNTWETFIVPVSEYSLDGVTLPPPKSRKMLFDTGGITLDISNTTMKHIASKYGGHYNGSTWSIACGAKPVMGYHFGATTIDVPLEHYVHKDDDGVCRMSQLNVVSDDADVWISGPPFLSRAMVIFDNTRRQVTLAKAKYTSESKIVEITGDIPGAQHLNDYQKRFQPTTLAVM